MPKLIDPLKGDEGTTPVAAKEIIKAARKSRNEIGSAELAVSVKPADIGPVPKGVRTKRDEDHAGKMARKADQRDPLKADFRNFLTLVWRFLGLPDPSAVVLSMAWWLQHGPARKVLLGFRGLSKSWVTGCYALWKLYCDPQKKVLVVSASLGRAVMMVNWCLALINQMPELQHLRPGPDQRSSSQAFDVGPARPDQQPSFKAVGVTGQMAGNRAHVIVPDDVEIPTNAMTVVMREKISEGVKEFDAIIHPGGEIAFLGTPQVEDSLYPKLARRGYTLRIWPARYPDAKMRKKYGDRLSPFITKRLEADPTLVGKPVWPERFPEEDLYRRELSYGRSGWLLQYMLDTSLSDTDRYPLKLRDLIVDGLDLRHAPDVMSWGNDEKLIVNDLPLLGFEGDRFYRPAHRSETYSEYAERVGFVDPSGRGGDETAMTSGAELHGRVHVLSSRGWSDGYGKETLKGIADECVRLRLHKLLVEDNFGDGMFVALLTPVVHATWKEHNDKVPSAKHGGTEIEAVRSPRVQKELRILSILEPATQGHRVVVSTEVIRQDFESVRLSAAVMAALEGMDAEDEATSTANTKERYSLLYQLSHLTRERDALLHDDRVEALAGLVNYFAPALGINQMDGFVSKEAERRERELEELFEDADEAASGGHGHSGRKAWEKRAHRGVRST